MTAGFNFGICATRGQRSYQEDAAATCPGEATFPWTRGELIPDGGRFLAVLADGMGGHAGGAKASRTVCEAFLEACMTGTGEMPERLVSALHAANEQIGKQVDANPQLAGMGTTMIGASFGVSGLEWISVGDSPLYLIRRNEIALLNEDHSLAPALDRLVAEGTISAEAARNDPRRHMLRSAITGEDIELVDLSRKPLALGPDDVVILASDGIHTLGEEEILRVSTGYFADGPEAIARALIRAVENHRAPHQDNTTVIVVQHRG
jgi:PPM family protein phosphatase